MLTKSLWLSIPRLLGLTLALVAASTSAQLAAVRTVEGIEEYRLPNGMQVLLARDDSKPSTTVNLTIKAGSRHENYGETGMAHLLEHLLFKGSARHPQPWGDFTKRGLRANGTTWLDRTNYFASFAANDDNLRWFMDWLSDAMVNSHIAAADLTTEMTVVRNEMEMGENSPERSMLEKTLAAMYQWHNYGKSTIGARSDVEQVDIERLRAFYRAWYRPDNAALVISGRFDPQLVRQLVNQYFAPLAKPAAPLPRLYTLDPVQDGEREVTLRRRGGTPSLMVGFHSVAGAHPDQAAAEVLSLIMGETPAGRLHQQLTQKQLAAGTWSWTPVLHDPGFILFGVTLAPGQDVRAAREALLQTLEGVADKPFTSEELERARRRWLKNWEQVFNDPEQLGVALSESVAMGDWRYFFLLRDRVEKVSLAQVQAFAQSRLLSANRTLGQFIPTEAPSRAPAPAAVNLAQEMASFQPKVAASSAEAFEATPAAIEQRAVRQQVDGIRGVQIPKGARGQRLTWYARIVVGDESSLKGQASVAVLTTALLDKGTRSLTRQQVQDRLDQLNAEVRFSFRQGVLSLVVNTRRDTAVATVELVAEMLRQPRLESATLDEIRRQKLAFLEQARREPQAIVSNALDRHANPYPRGDLRHGRTFDEIVQDSQAVTIDQVRAFHQRFLGAAQVQWAAVGEQDPAALRKAIHDAFKGWTTQQVRPQRLAGAQIPPRATRMEFSTPDKQNATILIRQPLPISDRHEDYAALVLGNFLLGQGGNSRLWMRLREKGGLSYDVRSTIQWHPHDPASTWEASAIFAPSNRESVEKALREEIVRALAQGFTDQEVAEGKTGLLNLRRLSRAQDDVLASLLVRMEDTQDTMQRQAQIDAQLQALNGAQVLAALRRHLKPDQFATAVAGDFKKP